MNPGQTPTTPVLPEFLEYLKAIGPTTVVIAAIITVTGAYLLERNKRKRERKGTRTSVMSALAGEISGVATLCETEYLPDLSAAAKRMSRGLEYNFGPRSSTVNFFPVFEKHVKSLGLLDAPLPAEVSNLYSRLFAMQENMRTMTTPGWELLPRARRQMLLRQWVKNMDALVCDGETLADKLTSPRPRPFRRMWRSIAKRFHKRKTITIDSRSFTTRDDEPKASALLRLANVDPSKYNLVKIKNNRKKKTYHDDNVVDLKNGDTFVTVVDRCSVRS